MFDNSSCLGQRCKFQHLLNAHFVCCRWGTFLQPNLRDIIFELFSVLKDLYIVWTFISILRSCCHKRPCIRFRMINLMAKSPPSNLQDIFMEILHCLKILISKTLFGTSKKPFANYPHLDFPTPIFLYQRAWIFWHFWHNPLSHWKKLWNIYMNLY